MRMVFPPIFRLLVLSFCCCTCVWAQEATANHNVVLRRDPTTSSPALEHLLKGARLTLIDATPDTGFYHVKTEDDRVGWVFGRFVSISSTEGTSVLAAPITPVAPSTPGTPENINARVSSEASDPEAGMHRGDRHHRGCDREAIEKTSRWHTSRGGWRHARMAESGRRV
jgi:hypothetical protein